MTLGKNIAYKPFLFVFPGEHPLSGGTFPQPPALAALCARLPPPLCFRGPFVAVDLLIDIFNKIQLPEGEDLKIYSRRRNKDGISRFQWSPCRTERMDARSSCSTWPSRCTGSWTIVRCRAMAAWSAAGSFRAAMTATTRARALLHPRPTTFIGSVSRSGSPNLNLMAYNLEINILDLLRDSLVL